VDRDERRPLAGARTANRTVLGCVSQERPGTLLSGEIGYGEPGYRDALCSLLSEAVVATDESAGVGLVIEFETGRLRVHPSRDELEGPEIAMLSGFEDGRWMVWRPDEDSFEDLA
jgi:hypothetical protein